IPHFTRKSRVFSSQILHLSKITHFLFENPPFNPKIMPFLFGNPPFKLKLRVFLLRIPHLN
ncbi:hypothetical protein CP10743SC13_1755, partial [Chlamydia psittaci 10_743_SC13]